MLQSLVYKKFIIIKKVEPKDKSNVKNILNTCRDTEDLLYKLRNIFYKVLVVPNSNTNIEIVIPYFCGIRMIYLNKNTYNRDIYRRDELTLITTIELLNADFECYDHDNKRYYELKTNHFNIYYKRIKNHFDTVVLDVFRPWSKKQIKLTNKQKAKELRALKLYHIETRKYFKEHIAKELLIKVIQEHFYLIVYKNEFIRL